MHCFEKKIHFKDITRISILEKKLLKADFTKVLYNKSNAFQAMHQHIRYSTKNSYPYGKNLEEECMDFMTVA